MRNWHAIFRLILLQHLLVLANLEILQTYWLEFVEAMIKLFLVI